MGQAARELLRSPTLICLMLGGLVMGALVAGNSFWGMMHFQRTLGLSPGQAGLLLGVQGGVTGVAGALGGGWLADRMSRKDLARCLTPAVIGMSDEHDPDRDPRRERRAPNTLASSRMRAATFSQLPCRISPLRPWRCR